jgi:hypothetical protein
VKLSGPSYSDWYWGFVRHLAVGTLIVLAIVGLMLVISALWNAVAN